MQVYNTWNKEYKLWPLYVVFLKLSTTELVQSLEAYFSHATFSVALTQWSIMLTLAIIAVLHIDIPHVKKGF